METVIVIGALVMIFFQGMLLGRWLTKREYNIKD